MDGVQVRLLDPDALPRCQQLLDEHHYLGSLTPVGQRLHYAVTDAHGDWLGVLVFCAAARRLRPREQWIGWSDEQRRRRLPLVVCNTRFLLLPHKTVPNLASKTLRLVLARLSDDWQARYDHPVLLVETFVDPEHFAGTLYSASGWTELGQTDGAGRHARDFYVRHDQPKRLFCRELVKNARRSLQAEHLRPALATLEAKAPARPTQTAPELKSLCDHFKAVPDCRARLGFYPLWSLLAIVACAHLADAPRGQKDLAAFAQRLSQRQRRVLGIRPDPQTGKYPAPSQPAFCRLYAQVDARAIERAVSLDALHTQDETARALVLDHGADYLLTVKANQSTIQENIGRLVAPPPVAFPPGRINDTGPHPRTQPRPHRNPHAPHGRRHA